MVLKVHISSHLFDSDTSKLPEIMRENLSPTTPEWLDNWKELLENSLAMNSKKGLTRKEVMREEICACVEAEWVGGR